MIYYIGIWEIDKIVASMWIWI